MTKGRVGLFVTCLVDLFRPTVGFAAVKLIEDAGYAVAVPPTQTCCGQPGFNSGDRNSARRLAEAVVTAFEEFDFVVVPSGSCGGMIKVHYPEIFKGDRVWESRAAKLGAKTHELLGFLADVAKVERLPSQFYGRVAYHDSCSSLREMKVREQPRRLLGLVAGVTVAELRSPEVCCGFGGTFCVKYPDISLRMVSDKAAEIVETGADTVLAGDLGCLMNIAGRLKREGRAITARHVAEVLAGMTDGPGIAEPRVIAEPRP
ncbi:MAG: (Fe-S)-binding protein [Alphaproteobacteria bacterium]|nr:(Fe-S)-binding protein [Alphaproteobacteria bacterium]